MFKLKALGACKELFQQSYGLYKQNHLLLRPCLYIIVINLFVLLCLILSGITFFTRPTDALPGVFSMAAIVIVLLPLRAFFRVRLLAVEAIMIYAQLKVHKNISFATAWKRTNGRGLSYWMLVLGNAGTALLKRATSQASRGLGPSSLIDPAWDFVSHYVIPVIAIENIAFHKACTRVRDLLDNAGTSVTGIVTIDLVEAGFRFVILCLAMLFAIVAISAAVAYMHLYGQFITSPLILALCCVILVGSLTKPFFDFIKILYFTSLYMNIRKS